MCSEKMERERWDLRRYFDFHLFYRLGFFWNKSLEKQKEKLLPKCLKKIFLNDHGLLIALVSRKLRAISVSLCW